MPTFPLSLPADPKPREITWKQATRVAVARSPFTGQSQVYAHPGQWWEVNFELPPLYGSTAAAWRAVMLRLNGSEGTFEFAPTDATPQSGDVSGTVVVDAVDGYELDLTGMTGTFTAGDWIQIENGLYQVTVGATAAAGAATIEVWPRPRSEITAETSEVEYTAPVGRFRLFEGFEWDLDVAKFHGFTIGAREVV
jgi:hypothetical protein